MEAKPNRKGGDSLNYATATQASKTGRVQVNIPKHIQDYLGWKPGDKLMVEENGAKDQVILTRIKKEKA